MNGKKEPLNGKIVFFGTSQFGIETLKLLHEKYSVLKVFTGLPKPAGRGKSLQKTPIHQCAENLGIEVNPCVKPLIEDLPSEFDLGIVVSYGCIIPKSILEKAKYGFLNLHPSNLPLFRGASPIERTLEAGLNETRICIIKMTPRLDDGDIVIFEHYNILPEEDSLILHEKFAKIGASLFPKAIEKMTSSVLESDFEKQDDSKKTYASKIAKEELFLQSEMQLKGQEIINKIRAFASFGFPFITFNCIRIKILKAIFSKERLTILDIKTLDGFVSPVLIKPEGKNTMQIKDFLNQF